MVRFLLLGVAFCAACTPDCKKLKGDGSAWAGVVCGAEGDAAPQLASTAQASACQPRAVMPQLYALLDANDTTFAGLRSALKDLSTPQCAVPQQRCASDDDCTVGACGADGKCPCLAPYSPLEAVMSVSIRGLGAVARDASKAEPGATGTPACLSPAAAKDLPADQRSSRCEMRRTLDVLLQQNGGQALIDDPNVRDVLLKLLAYVQGKTDGQTHYDLFAGVGRMASSVDRAACDPAALWQLLDATLGYLTPQKAAAQLGQLQTLLADPYTKTFLSELSGNASAQGRDSAIVLLHTLMPSLINAPGGAEALAAIDNLLDQLVYGSSSVPQSFKDEVRAVMTSTGDMLGASTGVFPPMQKMMACAYSPAVRCADPSTCTIHDDELVGALYDLLSRPELDGGLDLATIVGALKTLATLDQTGQVPRTLRMVAQGVLGDEAAQDAVADLARSSLTATEAQKLLPAVSVLVEKGVLVELFNFLHDLLYSCPKTP